MHFGGKDLLIVFKAERRTGKTSGCPFRAAVFMEEPIGDKKE
jgi:hypothetical protein